MFRVYLLLVCSIGLFLSSLLTVFSAPMAPLWVLAIVVGEGGQWGALLCVMVWRLADPSLRAGRVSSLLLVLAFFLFLKPSFQAWRIARDLPARLDRAFGVSSAIARSPYSFWQSFGWTDPKDIKIKELVYWEQGDEIRHLDIYRRSGVSEVRPLVVVIHGGGWSGGNKGELMTINRVLASRGYVVASVNYRLAPQWHSPAPADDIFHALDYLTHHAAALKIDPSQVVILGRSAGAQIALSVAYAEKNPAIKGVISFYGPTDMATAYNIPSRRGVMDSQKLVSNYLGGTPATRAQAYQEASPLSHITDHTPPTLLIQGGLDPIVYPFHSSRLEAALRNHQRPALNLALPWGTHGCDAILSGPSGQLSLYAVERFLKATIPLD